MRRTGILETMAHADLDALLEAVAAGYRPAAARELAARDPAWQDTLEAREREVGELFAALCAADVTIGQWRRAVAELRALWDRARDVRDEELDDAPALREVA